MLDLAFKDFKTVMNKSYILKIKENMVLVSELMRSLGSDMENIKKSNWISTTEKRSITETIRWIYLMRTLKKGWKN